MAPDQACQMAHLQTQNPDLGKFWMVLQWKMLEYLLYVHSVYFMAIWFILWPFGIFCGHLVHFSRFGML
jgi:hypothetical protein